MKGGAAGRRTADAVVRLDCRQLLSADARCCQNPPRKTKALSWTRCMTDPVTLSLKLPDRVRIPLKRRHAI